MEPTKAELNRSASVMWVGVEPVAKRLMNGLTDVTGLGSMETESMGTVSTVAHAVNTSPMCEFSVSGPVQVGSISTLSAGTVLASVA